MAAGKRRARTWQALWPDTVERGSASSGPGLQRFSIAKGKLGIRRREGRKIILWVERGKAGRCRSSGDRELPTTTGLAAAVFNFALRHGAGGGLLFGFEVSAN